MAGVTGLEPATSGVTGRHSNQLSYTPAGCKKDRARPPLTGAGYGTTPPKSRRGAALPTPQVKARNRLADPPESGPGASLAPPDQGAEPARTGGRRSVVSGPNAVPPARRSAYCATRIGM